MSRLTTALRSLGNAGALANVVQVLEHRRREDWLVEGLARRLEPGQPAAPAAGAPASSTHAA